MAEIQVPPSVRPSIPVLADLTKQRAHLLSEAIKSTPPNVSQRAYAAAVKAALPSSFPGASDLVDAVLSLAIGRDYVATTAEDFARSVSQDNTLKLTDRQRTVVRTRLTDLLKTESLALTAKIGNLGVERQNLVLDTRIVSEIRPIFGDNVDTGPKGAMVVHTLRIHHLNPQQEHVTTGYAMDPGDLAKLRAVLDRADEKQKALVELVEKNGLTYFTPAEG